jgi:hypothetical protein
LAQVSIYSQRMSRETDLRWFEEHRVELAAQYRGRWIVVLDGRLEGDFPSIEEAVTFAVSEHGVNRASVFQSLLKDPVLYFGGARSR